MHAFVLFTALFDHWCMRRKSAFAKQWRWWDWQTGFVCFDILFSISWLIKIQSNFEVTRQAFHFVHSSDLLSFSRWCHIWLVEFQILWLSWFLKNLIFMLITISIITVILMVCGSILVRGVISLPCIDQSIDLYWVLSSLFVSFIPVRLGFLTSQVSKVLTYSNPGIVFLFLLMFSLSTIMFCFFIRYACISLRVVLYPY